MKHKYLLFKLKVVCFLIVVLILSSSVFFASFCKEKTENKTLIIFVPHTLEDVVSDISKQFEKQISCKVVFNVAGTHVLVTQLKNGAKCDVFFSADKRYIDSLQKSNYIDKYQIFAKTKLCIVSNSSKVKKFEDISKKGVKLCIADPVSPIGKYTEMMFDNIKNDSISLYSKITSNVVSQEFDLVAVIQKVKTAQVDAAVVYYPDAKRTNLKIIDVPKKYNVTASSYVALVKKPQNPKLAKDFLSFVKTESVLKLLKERGYDEH